MFFIRSSSFNVELEFSKENINPRAKSNASRTLHIAMEDLHYLCDRNWVGHSTAYHWNEWGMWWHFLLFWVFEIRMNKFASLGCPLWLSVTQNKVNEWIGLLHRIRFSRFRCSRILLALIGIRCHLFKAQIFEIIYAYRRQWGIVEKHARNSKAQSSYENSFKLPLDGIPCGELNITRTYSNGLIYSRQT